MPLLRAPSRTGLHVPPHGSSSPLDWPTSSGRDLGLVQATLFYHLSYWVLVVRTALASVPSAHVRGQDRAHHLSSSTVPSLQVAPLLAGGSEDIDVPASHLRLWRASLSWASSRDLAGMGGGPSGLGHSERGARLRRSTPGAPRSLSILCGLCRRRGSR